jgi:hypothetical protein
MSLIATKSSSSSQERSPEKRAIPILKKIILSITDLARSAWVYALDNTADFHFSRYRKIGIGQLSIEFYQDYRNEWLARSGSGSILASCIIWYKQLAGRRPQVHLKSPVTLSINLRIM